MMDENSRKRPSEEFSIRVRAGRKRTYFFDVKETRNNDYFLIITESKKDYHNPHYYIKHKIFLYKEDFNKFLKALTESIDHIKTELLPDFHFDEYDHDDQWSSKSQSPNGPEENLTEEDDASDSEE